MKKYLMTGIAALAMCFGFTSCSHDVEPVSQEDLNKFEAQKIVDNYNQAFIMTFGQPAANQDWGFGATRAFTRSQGDNSCGECIKPDMTNYPSATAPAAITADERAFVKNWFETNPGFTQGLNISNFYVQHVWGMPNKEYNVFYNHYDQNRNPQNYRDDYVDRATMDYFCVGDGTNYTHTLDFNANNDGSGLETVYMKNSSALSFKYHSSWCSSEYTYFKCAEIDVPGVGKGWYVGLCMYGEKYDNGDRKLNKDQLDLQFADDWILKIVPGEGEIIPSEWDIRVIAEDLNASATTDKVNSDWDFNDVVFDVKFLDTPVDGKNVKIRIVAAGGTYPLYVAGQEVHALFEQNTDVMINTNASAYGKHYETTELPIFYVYDANAESTNGKSIAVTVDMGNGQIEMTAEVGKPAAKIGVSPNFNYCMERVDITTQYPLFNQWVTTATPATGWWNSTITGQ